MNVKRLLKYLAPFAIVGLVAIFIYNLFHNGRIEDPGPILYKSECSGCHGDNGEGVKTLVPPLTNDSFAILNFDSIPCWFRYGLSHPIIVGGKTYDQPMYPNGLDEIQAANVINYVSGQFFNSDKRINSQWVLDKWKKCGSNVKYQIRSKKEISVPVPD